VTGISGLVNSRLRASVVSLVVGHHYLHSEYIPLPAIRTPHKQQADVFITKRIKVSNHSIDVFKSIIVVVVVVVRVVTILGPKVGIVVDFKIIIIVRAGSLSSLPFCID
jgi:hypothetical protein